VADEFKVPLIADEIYYGLVYDEEVEFHSFANLTSDVPIIATGGLSKIFCLPGWRCGWAIIYNNHGYFDKVIENFGKQSMILLHPASIVQFALPKILKMDMDAHFNYLKDKLRPSSAAAFKRLSTIEGVVPIKA
jgi:aspartate/methionine/tyrosine aminotransferase